jgi:hypothetical protein
MFDSGGRGGSLLAEAGVGYLYVPVRFGEGLTYHVERGGFALASLCSVDFLTSGRQVATPVGEVATRRDPVWVERPVVVLEDGDTDLRAVAGTDGRLVRSLCESPGRVEAGDAGAPARADVSCIASSFVITIFRLT